MAEPKKQKFRITLEHIGEEGQDNTVIEVWEGTEAQYSRTCITLADKFCDQMANTDTYFNEEDPITTPTPDEPQTLGDA